MTKQVATKNKYTRAPRPLKTVMDVLRVRENGGHLFYRTQLIAPARLDNLTVGFLYLACGRGLLFEALEKPET